MTDNRAPELDPRYDPAFQRHGSTAPPAPPAPERTRWADPVPMRVDRAHRAGHDDHGHPADERIGAPPDAPERIAPVTDGPAEHDTDPAPASRTRRWELAILITAVALIGGGVALGTFAVRLSFNGYTVTGNEIPIEYLIGQFGYQLAPPLIVVGLASLVGLLFLRAAAARGLR